MRLLQHQIGYSSASEVIRLYYLTDTHVGAAACDEKALQRDIDAIAADPNAFWIGGGDFIDCIARKGDRRADEEALAPWLHGRNDVIGTQIEYVTECFLNRIAHKCLGLVEGNHERAALVWNDRNVYRAIVDSVARASGRRADELAIGVQGYVQISFRWFAENDDTGGNGWRMTVYCHHGYGGGRLPGGHALTLGRVLGDYECDLAFMGHRHTQLSVNKIVTRVAGKKIVAHPRTALFVPSYLRTWIIPSGERGNKGLLDKGVDRMPIDLYPELMGLPQSPIGTIPVLIQPYNHNHWALMGNGVSSGLDALQALVGAGTGATTTVELRDKKAAS